MKRKPVPTTQEVYDEFNRLILTAHHGALLVHGYDEEYMESAAFMNALMQSLQYRRWFFKEMGFANAPLVYAILPPSDEKTGIEKLAKGRYDIWIYRTEKKFDKAMIMLPEGNMYYVFNPDELSPHPDEKSLEMPYRRIEGPVKGGIVELIDRFDQKVVELEQGGRRQVA